MLSEDGVVENIATDGDQVPVTEDDVIENDDIFGDVNPSVEEENTDIKTEDHLTDTDTNVNKIEGQIEELQEFGDAEDTNRSIPEVAISSEENETTSEEQSENETSENQEINENDVGEEITRDQDIYDVESTSVDVLSLAAKKSERSVSSDDFDIFMKSDSTQSEENDSGSSSKSGHLDEHLEEPSTQASRRSSIRSKKKRKSKSRGYDDDVTLSMVSFATSEHSSAPGEEHIEEEKQPKEEETLFDREMYCAMYDNFTQRYQEAQNKNSFLHRKVSEYYRKRRMFHVLAESKIMPDIQKKYNKQLEQIDELFERNENEQARIREGILYLKINQVGMEDEAKLLFKKLQDSELELGREFESTDNKGAPSGKAVERYLKKQKNQLTNMIKMRLDYIKLKNRYYEKKTALDALDNLGSNLHLIDYEQLKFDNRNLHDKLEEKDNELIRIRIKCQNAMQTLAHVREKTDAVNNDIQFLMEGLETSEGEYADVREELNGSKQKRDAYRKAINQMKNKTGLLAKPKLLRDMEKAIEEINSLSTEATKYKAQWENTMQIVGRMRKTMESPKKINKLRAKLSRKKANLDMNSESTASSDFQFPLENGFLIS